MFLTHSFNTKHFQRCYSLTALWDNSPLKWKRHSVIIYKPSCSSNPVWFSFWCNTHKKTGKQTVLATINFHCTDQKKKKNTFLKISALMLYRRKGVIQVWSLMQSFFKCHVNTSFRLKSYQSAFGKLMDYNWPQHYAYALKNNGDVRWMQHKQGIKPVCIKYCNTRTERLRL